MVTGNENIQLFILWTVILTLCFAITPEVDNIGGPKEIDRILSRAFMINKHRTTLRGIYGDVVITENNFKPGLQLSTALKSSHRLTIINREDFTRERQPNDAYVDRQFTMSSSSRLLNVKDTPTAIAEDLAKNIMTNNRQIILIIGDVQMGKTTALEKIRMEWTRRMPTMWIVTIDLLSMVQFDHQISRLSLEYIITHHIPEKVRSLFDNVIELNPKKIVFLFDNVDKMSERDGRALRTALLIKKIADRGATIIVTGRTYTKSLLEKQNLNVAVYEIPEMNIIETENFLKNYWKQQIFQVPEMTSASLINIDERLNGYATAFTHALFKIPIPRFPMSLLTLAIDFELAIEINSEQYDFPVSCFDYVLSEKPLSPMLLHNIEHITVDKLTLYENLIKEISLGKPPITDANYLYSSIAAKQMIDGDRLPELVPSDVLENDARFSRQFLYQTKELALFVNIISQQFHFINPDYKYFFAKEYFTQISDNFREDIYLIQKILTEPYYRDVMEFIEPFASDMTFGELDILIFHNGRLIHKLLDNIMSYGYENLLLQIVIKLREENSLRQLQEYFLKGHSIEYRSERVLGMRITTKLHPDVNPVAKPLQKSGTALELLIENEMTEVCKILLDNGIIFRAQEDWQKLLQIAVSKPVPSLEHIQLIMTRIVPITFRINFDNLLYHTINVLGVASLPVAKYIVRIGAEPSKVIENGRTLLHAAVQWNSVELLRFVVETLHVPAVDTIDNFGRTVFETALDANPSPFHTAPGWWEMMSYLTQKVDILSLPFKEKIQDMNFKIPLEDIESPWFKFILSAEYIESKLDNSDVRALKCYPAPVNDVAIKRHAILSHFIPSSSWYLSPNTLALRRQLLLQKLDEESSVISPIELLINYRGIGSLSPAEWQHYTMTIKFLSERDANILPIASKARILEALLYNVYETKNNADLKYLQNNNLFLSLENVRQSELLDTLHEYLPYAHLDNPSIEPVSVYGRLLSSKFNEFQEIREYLEIKYNDFKNSRASTGSTDSGYEPSYNLEYNPEICLSHVTRRAFSSRINCLYSWDDVDKFNEARNRQSVLQIRINSDRFLNTLAAVEYENPDKGRQLVELVKYLRHNSNSANNMLGESILLMQDVLREGSLMSYRTTQRITNIINNFWQPSSGMTSGLSFRLPSRSATLHAISGIPFVRGIYATVAMCLQLHNDTSDNCLYASSVFALSTSLIPVGIAAVKYTPWLIQRGTSTALELLPSVMPSAVRQNLNFLHLRGGQYGSQTAAVTIGILGLGFDLYNVIQMSNMINLCNQEGNNCSSKDEIDYIISLSFSCVSIVTTTGLMISGAGFATGVLIGLALLTLETLALGSNDVIFYENKYETTFGESLRIFFHKISFQPPPADVQSLAHRTDWVQNLETHVTQYLNTSNENIVAYGIGIGMVTTSGAVWGQGLGFINMGSTNLTNANGLSRVLPTGYSSSLLCLPKRDSSKAYDTISKQVYSAVYECHNSFVIAHKERWEKRNSTKSYIIYDLKYVDRGSIIGSDTVNNLFLIYNSTSTLSIHGGGGNTRNIYMIREDTFNGLIIFNRDARDNIIDFSDVQSTMMTFSWIPSSQIGYVRFDNNNTLNLMLHPRPSINNFTNLSTDLRVIGLEKNSDHIDCGFSESIRYGDNTQILSVDSRGGKSSLDMDYVHDCKISILRPFTSCIGSNDANITYETYILLDTESSPFVYKNLEVAIIQPKQSKFIVTFLNRPIYITDYSVQYIRSNGKLKWRVRHKMSSPLLLSIEPFRSRRPTQQKNTMDESFIETINCLFVDSYSGTTILPEIHVPADNRNIINVRYFNIFATVNSSRFDDVLLRYHQIKGSQGQHLIIRKKLTDEKTGRTYTFGSSVNDRFYIDANTQFMFGNDGQDVYVLNSNSPKEVWIDNQANDNALDTLIISDTTCHYLKATMGSLTSNLGQKNLVDVTLSCFVWPNLETPIVNVVLRSYLIGSDNRHLQIYWQANTYIPLLPSWLNQLKSNNSSPNQVIQLALFVSFSENWEFTSLTVNSYDTFVVFNITDVTNSLVAYKSTRSRDIILVRKYLMNHSSPFVVLRNFFANYNSIDISTDWLTTKFFIMDGKSHNDEDIKLLDVNYFQDLYLNSLTNNATQMENNPDFIQEYFVNMTVITRNNSKIIEHNNESPNSGMHRANRLGILIVVGATPENFRAQWNYNENSLELCARQSCIYVKNWCHSAQHRLYRIEFVRSLVEPPIFIHDLNQLKCPEQTNNSDYSHLIKQLNQKFDNAQQQWSLTDRNSDADSYRLLKCVGSILTDIIAHKSMHRLFGFTSIVEQAEFMYYNCKKLLTKPNLEELSHEKITKMVENEIQQFFIREPPKQQDEMKDSITHILNQFLHLGLSCWQQFKTSLYKQKNTSKFQFLDDNSILHKCLRSS